MILKIEGGLRLQNIKKESLVNKPQVSIVTVVYNGKSFLEETIQSVINQAYENVEYIIIDGGSTDGTLEIIKKYEDKIDYWVSEKDKGISDAFNKGISSSTGDWILFLNAGDTFFNNSSLSIFNTFIDASVIITQVELVGIKNNRYIIGHKKPLAHKLPTSHQSIFYKTSIFDEFGFYDTSYKFAMDYEHYLRFRNKIKFAFIDKVTSTMPLNGASAINPSYTHLEMIKADLKNKNIFIYLNILKYLFLLIKNEF